MNRLTVFVMGLPAVLVLAAGSPAVADDCAWNNLAGGTFQVPGNWNPHAPGANDVAIFHLGIPSAYHVGFADNADVYELRVRTGTIDLDLNGYTCAVAENLFVGWGPGDLAHLRFNNGLLTSTFADVGHFAGQVGCPGEMTLSGPTTSWVDAMDLTVGRGTEGTVNVSAGASVSIDRGTYVGNCLSGESEVADGVIDVTGEDSSWTTGGLDIGISGFGGTEAMGTVLVSDHAALITDYISVGSSASEGGPATGTVLVSDHAALITDHISVGGSGPGGGVATGSVTITGYSTVSTSGIVVGQTSEGDVGTYGSFSVADHAEVVSTRQFQVGMGTIGEMFIESDATVECAKASSGSGTSCVIGGTYGPGYVGDGTVTVAGEGTTWTQDGSIAVGFNGLGELYVQEGAVVESAAGHIARRAGSEGTAHVTGEGTLWAVADELYVGGEASPERGGLGHGGTATLRVDAQAGVTVGSRLEVWHAGFVDIPDGYMLVGAGTLPATPGTLLVGPGGTVAGTSYIAADLVNTGGTVDVGHSTGMLEVNNFQQGISGTLEIDLEGPDSDQFGVLGNATLDGNLGLKFGGPDMFEAGAYTLMTYDTRSGFFGTVTDLGAYVTGNGLTYETHELTLTVDHDLLLGDLDLDGDVDFFDYIATSNNFGETEGMGFQDGDMDGDGDVDFFDYIAVSNHFSDTLPTSASVAAAASVPEPTTIVLLVTGALAVVACARRRRRAA